jgi:hypothetical protein
MKFSNKTLEILKSFNNINPSLLLKTGNVISTIDKEHTILAMARIDEEIPREFAIYELSKFLGALSVMPDGEIDLGENQLTIKTNNSKIKYTYAEPAQIKASPYKEIPLNNILATFNLDYTSLSNVIKAASVLELTDISIRSDEDSDDILIYASNDKNPTTDSYQIKVGESSSSFKVSFKVENMKLLNREYNVSIPDGAFVKFTAPDITYWVAAKSS